MEQEDKQTMTRDGLASVLRELAGVCLEPAELDRLHRRLSAIRAALGELRSRLHSDMEPLPTVDLGGCDE